MRRALFTVIGIVLAAVASYYLVGAVGAWYDPHYIRSDADIDNFMIAGLSFQALCMVAGGVVGYRLARRPSQGV